MGELIEFGSIPWSRQDMIDKLYEFSILWDKRIIQDNRGGMLSVPMFHFWFILQYLQPKIVIESGIFRGLGTWFAEQACPNAQIFCIEPRQGRIRYRSSKAMYFEQDFSKIPWHKYIDNFSDVLFFVDDHQNDFSRVALCKEWGIKTVLFEDNYDINLGDNFSLKKAFYDKECANYLFNTLKTYYELPPIFAGKQWRGHVWTQPTQTSLLSTVTEQWQQIYKEQEKEYTWFCYVELK